MVLPFTSGMFPLVAREKEFRIATIRTTFVRWHKSARINGPHLNSSWTMVYFNQCYSPRSNMRSGRINGGILTIWVFPKSWNLVAHSARQKNSKLRHGTTASQSLDGRMGSQEGEFGLWKINKTPDYVNNLLGVSTFCTSCIKYHLEQISTHATIRNQHHEHHFEPCTLQAPSW